jgi:hypothetical protein
MRTLLPSAAWTRAIIIPALVFIATAIDRNYQTDFWHHLARGQAIAAEGMLLNHDRFTYTVADQPFQDANWLTQLFYHYTYQCGGLPLVQTVNSLVLALMIGLVVWQCQRATGSLLVADMVGALVFFGIWQTLIIRPQTFSLLLFMLLSLVLSYAAERPRLLLCAPPIMALWANMHGGFPIGLVLIGAHALGAFIDAGWRRGRGALRDSLTWSLALCLTASVLATLVNPYGWRVYQYVGVTSTAAANRRIDEWLPPSLNLLAGKLFIASILLVLILLALPGRRPTVRQMCLLVCFLPLAFGSVRMVVWWWLVAAPIVAELLVDRLPAHWLAEDPEPPSLSTAAWFAAICLACVLSLPWLENYNPAVSKLRGTHRVEYDLEALAQRLEREPRSERIFSRFEWSEYLGWRLQPTHKIFMDGRIEIFPDAVWAQYDAVTRGRADWEQILDQYGVNCLLVDTAGYHAGLLPQVERSSEWHKAAEAGDAVLYVRHRALSGSPQASAAAPAERSPEASR